MVYAPDSGLLKQENKQAPSGVNAQFTGAAPQASTPAMVGSTAVTAPLQQPSKFQNIRSYLAENAPVAQKIGEKAEQKATEDIAKTRAGVEKAAGAYTQKATEAANQFQQSVTPQQAQSQQAGTVGTMGTAPLTQQQATPVFGQTGYVQSILSKAAQGAELTPQETQTMTEILKGTGQQELLNQNPIMGYQQNIAKAQQLAKTIGTESGRQELLNATLTQPKYSRGESALDALLLSSSPQVTQNLVSGVKGTTKDLADFYNQQASDVTSSQDALKAYRALAKQKSGEELLSQASGLEEAARGVQSQVIGGELAKQKTANEVQKLIDRATNESAHTGQPVGEILSYYLAPFSYAGISPKMTQISPEARKMLYDMMPGSLSADDITDLSLFTNALRPISSADLASASGAGGLSRFATEQQLKGYSGLSDLANAAGMTRPEALKGQYNPYVAAQAGVANYNDITQSQAQKEIDKAISIDGERYGNVIKNYIENVTNNPIEARQKISTDLRDIKRIEEFIKTHNPTDHEFEDHANTFLSENPELSNMWSTMSRLGVFNRAQSEEAINRAEQMSQGIADTMKFASLKSLLGSTL